jgi:hypothetical protein
MTKEDYKTFEKDHIQKLQQRVDELETRLKHTINELKLCQEDTKYPTELSKGNKTITPLPKFEPPDVSRLVKGRIEAMKNYSKKKR